MKLLHICPGNLYGGVESMLATIAREQAVVPDLKHDFAVCFSSRLADELTALGNPPFILGSVRLSRPWTIQMARRRLSALLLEKHYDAVVTHMSWAHAIFAPVVRQDRISLIHWMHSYSTGRISDWIERWAGATRPDLVIANSRFTAGSVSNLFGKCRIPQQIVPCPVALDELCLTTDERDATRDALTTPRDAIVIVQVGRMESLKGHEIHIDALAALMDLPAWRLWIVGGAQRQKEIRYVESLKKRTAALGLSSRVQFLGERNDIPRLLGAADIYCQPNRGPESFGISFIEALNARLPLVTSAHGGAVEIIDATCGLSVPPNAVDALSAALRTLILDPVLRKTLGGEGPSKARELCSPFKSLEKLRAAIIRLVGPTEFWDPYSRALEKSTCPSDEPTEFLPAAPHPMSGASHGNAGGK